MRHTFAHQELSQVPGVTPVRNVMDPLPATHPNPKWQSRTWRQRGWDLSLEPKEEEINQIQITNWKY